MPALRGALSLYVLSFTSCLGQRWRREAIRPPCLSTKAMVGVFQPYVETNPAVLMFIVLSGYWIQKSWMKISLRAAFSYAARSEFSLYSYWGSPSV